MKNICTILIATMLIAMVNVTNAQNLISEYNFDGNLSDKLGGSTLNKFGSENDGYNHNNATFGFATDANGAYSYWTSTLARGGGYWVDVNTDISTNYSIGIRFSFENTVTSYRKIIDFKNMTSDNGFYFYGGGKLNFYPNQTLGNSTTLNNQIVDIIITRASDNTFKAYIVVNNVLIQELDIADIAGNAIAELVNGKPRFRFFHDDIETTSEATPGGKVYSIKIWDGPITDIGGAMNNSWTGTASTDWSSIANWSKNAIPVSSEDVVIPDASSTTNDPMIDITSAVCNNLTINSNGILVINTGKALTVNGTLTNNSGNSGLVIESGGSLIETTTGVDAIIKRAIPPNEWHLIAAPTSNSTAGIFYGHFLQKHTEASNTYNDLIDPGEELTPMKGYAIWGDLDPAEVTFVGPLNAGSYSFNTTKVGEGWNLVGNPYPSSIDWKAASGWTKTNVNEAIYLHRDAATWATFVGNTGANGGTQYIAPGQGFFVQAASDGILAMTDEVRVHNATAFFKSSGEVVPNLIRLEVSGNGYKDEAVVHFLANATPGFDGSFDAHKFFGDVAEAAQIYSTGSTPLAINSLPETDMVQVGIKAGTSGTYTIAATEINNLQYATLEDIKTGIFTQLADNSYTFNFDKGDNEMRFKLHFSMTGTKDNKTADAAIYSYQKTAYIILNSLVTGDIFIYNISGQLIASKTSAAGTIVIELNNTGIYFVKVVTDKTTLEKKICFQK
jgi:hypothetical protein